MPRDVAPAIGRVVAFIALLVACSLASYSFVTPLLTRFAFFVGRPIRADVYAELIAVLGATGIMVRSVDRRPWSDLDLSGASFSVLRLVSGFGVGAFANGAACGVLLVAGLLQFVPAGTESGWLGAAVRVTLVLLPAALAEELMCRGYLLTVIREVIGVRGAIVLTSVMFGLLHLNNPDATAESLLVVIMAGLFLGSVRVATRSLYAAWMAHFAWNWIMAVPLHASVSGLRFEAPGYFSETLGPAWLSGGTWGPEGGIVAALGLIAGLGYLYSRRFREES